ncbi:SDR family oxidoreductase [Balneolaceae bacterium ANBcel3]|nr:SDR family oxidoreductase [Balneolaceae bacterium ANBcel3]
MPERVVITGGAGFIGSHLCARFLNVGYEVVCIDNLSTGSKDNIASFLDRPDFFFIKHDVTEYIYVDGPVDLVLHFASPASPADYLDLPIQTLKVGSLGTHKAMGLAKAKSARFLLASTSEIYGNPLQHPQSEEYFGNVNPVGLRGVYDESKRFAEAMVMAYHRNHGVSTRIARIFNTYGPNMRLDDGRVLPNFFSQALQKKALTIYGDGSQTRSFCFISDIVEGIFRLCRTEYHDPVNLGNPEEISIKDLAEMIVNLTGTGAEIAINHPLPDGDPQVRKPDISRAMDVLGWKPVVGREDGLKITLDYFKKKVSEIH